MMHLTLHLCQRERDNCAQMRKCLGKDKVVQCRTRHQVTVDQCQSAALGAANRINSGSGPQQTTSK